MTYTPLLVVAEIRKASADWLKMDKTEAQSSEAQSASSTERMIGIGRDVIEMEASALGLLAARGLARRDDGP